MEIRPEEVRLPGGDEISVNSLASGISQGTEMLVLRGLIPKGVELDLPTLQGSYGFPIKFGYASVGSVTEVGSNVQRIKVGDRVFVHHPHQTRYVVPESAAVLLDARVDPAIGTLLANVETAVNISLDSAPRIGETVVVFGQGIVGALVACLLETMRTVTVIRVEPSEERRSVIEPLASGFVVDSQDSLLALLKQTAGSRGADIAIECSGNPDALNDAINCVAQEGTVVVASWYGTKRAALDLGGSFHRKRLRLRSSQVGAIAPELYARWNRDRRLDVARDLLTKLPLDRLVTHKIPFREAPDAYKLLQEQPGAIMQAVLTYGAGDV